LHTAKNAIDHGLELPTERVAAGKPAAGQLLVAFAHSAGALRVTIADDGRGLDRERIRRRAHELGIPTAQASEAEILDLIFRPGFSTSSSVSDVSGRGVGLDAVRATVSALGGSLKVDSRHGAGTSIVVTLPGQAVYGADHEAASKSQLHSGEVLLAGATPIGAPPPER
jgi:two-component system chemotaxis sensor kinase CheA